MPIEYKDELIFINGKPIIDSNNNLDPYKNPTKQIHDNIISAIFNKKYKITIITGAGVSVPSGIPCFRGSNGLNNLLPSNIEKVLSYEFLKQNPNEFYEFYTRYMLKKDIEPNIIHKTLAELEQLGYIDIIITQNIDGLHQKAGSRNVIELHGNNNIFYCDQCNTIYNIEHYIKKGWKCQCNGIIRPNIVLYNEYCDHKKLEQAKEYAKNADIRLVLGSSLAICYVKELIHVPHYFTDENSSPKFIYRPSYIITDEKRINTEYQIAYQVKLEDLFKEINEILKVIKNEKRKKL